MLGETVKLTSPQEKSDGDLACGMSTRSQAGSFIVSAFGGRPKEGGTRMTPNALVDGDNYFRNRFSNILKQQDVGAGRVRRVAVGLTRHPRP